MVTKLKIKRGEMLRRRWCGYGRGGGGGIGGGGGAVARAARFIGLLIS